jgi:SlyX protein
MEDQLIELETRLAFQEEAIDALHQGLLHQQRVMERLTRQLEQLHLRVLALTPSPLDDNAPEAPPPHY